MGTLENHHSKNDVISIRYEETRFRPWAPTAQTEPRFERSHLDIAFKCGRRHCRDQERARCIANRRRRSCVWCKRHHARYSKVAAPTNASSSRVSHRWVNACEWRRRTKSDRSAAAPGLAYSTEEMMHPLGYLFALVGQGAMTAVCQLDLCVWHRLAIPQLIFTREQNIVLPAHNQRRRAL
jgi:hypothetical protein